MHRMKTYRNAVEHSLLPPSVFVFTDASGVNLTAEIFPCVYDESINLTNERRYFPTQTQYFHRIKLSLSWLPLQNNDLAIMTSFMMPAAGRG